MATFFVAGRDRSRTTDVVFFEDSFDLFLSRSSALDTTVSDGGISVALGDCGVVPAAGGSEIVVKGPASIGLDVGSSVSGTELGESWEIVLGELAAPELEEALFFSVTEEA